MKRQGWFIFLFCGFILTAWSVSLRKTEHFYNPKPVKLLVQGNNTYDKQWKTVDSLQNLGLYKSASELVQQMFERAISENNANQVVKSMMYRLKYNNYIQEEDYKMNITSLEKYSAMANFPVKQILHSITADMYHGFYQQNRWRFYDRSTTVDYKPDDILTWDATTIANKIRDEHLLALSESEKSKTAAIESFEDILSGYYKEHAAFRPTLYDFLAHRAFDFFAHNEFDVTKPAVRFSIDDPAYLGHRNVFLQKEISSTDSLSTRYYAARIIKDLVAFHNNDKDPHSLVVVDLERLQFIKSNSAIENADSLYYQTLEQMAAEFVKHKAVTEIMFQIASVHHANAGKYNPLESDKYRWENVKAREICKKADELFPNSYGANQCRALVSQMEYKSISASFYDVTIPNKPAQLNITSANMDKAYVRIINTGWDFTYDDDYYEQEKFMKKMVSYKAVKEWEVNLKDEKDLQSHTMEIPVEGMPAGSYYILISAEKTFPVKSNAIAYARMDVSDITYMTKQTEKNEYDVFVMSRTNGSAVANAKVKMFYSEYDYKLRRYRKTHGATYTTDADGYIKIPATTKDDYRYFYLDITTATDRYSDERSYYQYKYYPQTPYTTVRTHYFLDRKIYRPGQTIYFKGIRIESTDDKHTLQTNESVTVTLYDVNYQKVSDVTLVTNEYGSFSGSFTAPQGVLNGQMHIGDSNGNMYFSVEEYKRPKFEVQFKPVEGTYRLADKVTARGNAKSYSGVNVDGAQVKYRVMRYTYFWHWYWWWGSRPNAGSMEITNGETKTDENGNFEVKFEAIPDKGVSNKYQPYYSYTVFADVTDINGETHSSQQVIYASNVGFSISMGLSEYANRSESEWVSLSTRNLNGTNVDAQGQVTIYKLKTPERVLQDRKLTEPDRHLQTKEEFTTSFPFEVYGHENEIERMERGEKVFSASFDTKKMDSVQVKGIDTWAPGAYVAEAISKDQWGNEIKEIKTFTLFATESTQLPYPMPFFMRDLKTYCEPGDTARFLFGTGFENARILYEVNGKKGLISKEWLTVSNKQVLIEIPITEEHRGNLSVHFNFVYNNRSYMYNSSITVPFTNKELDITFETFRNKLYPGEKEQWKINLKGKKGEKVAAELLLGMYDASLDAFASNYWSLSIYNSYYGYRNWDNYAGYGTAGTTLYQEDWNEYYSYPSRYFYSLNWFGFYPGYYTYGWGTYGNGGYYDSDDGIEYKSYNRSESGNTRQPSRSVSKNKKADASKSVMDEMEESPAAELTTATEKESTGDVLAGAISGKDAREQQTGLGNVQARKNLAETAFFFPQLETDENGNVSVTFTMPESLTKWKVMGLGHTKDLKSGTTIKEIVTQKDVMVVPNMPRFLRQGDEITLVTKISNISDKDLTGDAQLILFDALTSKPVDDRMDNNNSIRSFNVKAAQSTSVSWTIKVPDDIDAVTYKVVARSGKFSDGEEAALPVLSNRMLVIESMPLHIRKTGEKTFTLNKLIESGSSSTLKSHRLTLEFTDNPAWYAIQALPYIMEYPYECAEQTFARFYANSIAQHVVNSSPKIKTVFDTWKNASPETFLSNLHKNQELKSVILEETPWVMEANDESERKKRIGLLFDFNRMSNELESALRKLQKAQVSNGGWPWFPGMPESRYITQHIVTGMGHLDKLGVKNIREDGKTWNMVRNGVRYLDNRIEEDYRYIKKHYTDYKTEQHISYDHVQYLYARSYFKDVSMDKGCTEAVDYFREQAKKFWLKFNIYSEGMIALALNRWDDKKVPADILKSLKERSLSSEEMGRWWKDNSGGWYWYEAHVETQALLIECFDEVGNDLDMVNELKVWLLKHKQTNAWHTTKATTEACYALLMRGTDWLVDDHQVDITVGNQKIDTKAEDVKREAGTGYFKMTWTGKEIKPEMGKVVLKTSKDRVSWGALHWQYFEDLDKITTHATGINIMKKLFIVQDNASGNVIKPISDKNKLKIGDKIRVRIELRTDRDMEYVHMKDMRASGFEPLNVFSRYKYQDGLGYYESTRDAATHFFFDRIRKGTYVFEYDLRVTHSGKFSNGITQIQCMYAPEFNSHSEGLRVEVDKKEK